MRTIIARSNVLRSEHNRIPANAFGLHTNGRLIFIVSRTLAVSIMFSQLAGRARRRPSGVFPGRPGPRCGRRGRPAGFGAWLRRPARVGFRTHPDGLEGPAYSVPRSGAATARAAPRRGACGPPLSPRPSCPAPRRGPSRRRARRGARARRRPGRRAACRWRTCRPGTASARS